MWCPNCGAEYRPGFARCSDCDVELVAEQPPEPEPSPRGLTALDDLDRLGPGPAEVFIGPHVVADLMRSVLEGSGIDCVVWRPGFEEAYGALPHRVLVRATDAERAGEIILAARSGELEIDALPDEDGAETLGDEDDELAWIQPSSERIAVTRQQAAAGPIAEVDPWWRHPGLGGIVSVVRVLFGIAIVVGLAYLILAAIAD